MLVGVFIESRGAEASLMDGNQGLIEISLFVKDGERNHLGTIIGVTAYLNPPTLGWEEADMLSGQDLGQGSMTGGVR